MRIDERAFLALVGAFSLVAVAAGCGSNDPTTEETVDSESASAQVVPLAATSCQSSVHDLFANPFEKASAYHRPIGGGAEFADDNHPSTVSLLENGFNEISSNNGFGFNVYRSTAADPLVTVTYAGPPANVGLPVTLHVPRAVNIQPNTDAVIVIYDSTGDSVHEFYHWRANGGKPTAAVHRPWSIRGLGHSQPGGPRVGVSASGVAGLFGLIRGDEINTPGRRIEHALQMTLSYAANCANQIAPKVVWPAAFTDGYCKTDPPRCTGHIPYGALLALPPSINSASLGLSEPGQRLAAALQNYGTYVVDTTQACPNMRGDQNIDPGVKQTLKNDMRKIYPNLRMVLNNSAGQSAAGGGAPRAPNCAFDAPR